MRALRIILVVFYFVLGIGILWSIPIASSQIKDPVELGGMLLIAIFLIVIGIGCRRYKRWAIILSILIWGFFFLESIILIQDPNQEDLAGSIVLGSLSFIFFLLSIWLLTLEIIAQVKHKRKFYTEPKIKWPLSYASWRSFAFHIDSLAGNHGTEGFHRRNAKRWIRRKGKKAYQMILAMYKVDHSAYNLNDDFDRDNASYAIEYILSGKLKEPKGWDTEEVLSIAAKIYDYRLLDWIRIISNSNDTVLPALQKLAKKRRSKFYTSAIETITGKKMAKPSSKPASKSGKKAKSVTGSGTVTCHNCHAEYSWSQGNPAELTRVEQMICLKENLPFEKMKKITCPFCGTQKLAQKTGSRKSAAKPASKSTSASRKKAKPAFDSNNSTDKMMNLNELEKKAKSGDPQAQYELGTLFREGEEVSQDMQKAVYWYEQACDQGHADALFRLGLLYGSGEGVPADDAEARRLIKLAADQGHAQAAVTLEYLGEIDDAAAKRKRDLGL